MTIGASDSAVTVNDVTLSEFNLRVLGGMIELGQIAIAAGLILQLLSVGMILDNNGAKENLTGGGAAILGATEIGTDDDPLEIDVASLVIGSLRSIFNLITGTDPPTSGHASIPLLPLFNNGTSADSSNNTNTTAYLSFSQSILPLITVNGADSNDRIVLKGASGVGQLFVAGGEGDDTLVVDFGDGNPIPSGGLFYDGGSLAYDSLLIFGGFFQIGDVSIESNYGDGEFTVRWAILRFVNLEPVSSTSSSATFTLHEWDRGHCGYH